MLPIVRFHPFNAGFPHRNPMFTSVDKFDEAPREFVYVTRVKHFAVHTCSDEFVNALHAAGDNRQTCPHRLQHNERHPFRQRWQDENIRAPILLWQFGIRHRARKVNMRCDTEVLCQMHQFVTVGPVADDFNLKICLCLFQNLRQRTD